MTLRATAALVVVQLLLMLSAVMLGRTLLAQPGISYEELQGGNQSDIVLLDIEHRLHFNLTANTALNISAAWSPDGTRMAYLSVSSGGTVRLHVRTLEGGVRLFNLPQKLASTHPVWSPDGKSVIYGIINGGATDLAIVDVDVPLDAQTNPRIFVTSQGADGFPMWSPDGAQMAFVSSRRGNANIYLSNADGSRVIPLTDHPGEDVSPAWSPDSSQIAYFSLRDRYRQLYVINRDGSGARQLTNTLDVNSGQYWAAPVWSPDGRQLAYINVFDGVPKIVVSQVDGSGERRLIGDIQHEAFPRWLGDRIVYIGRNRIFTGVYIVSAGGSGEALTPYNVEVGALELWHVPR